MSDLLQLIAKKDYIGFKNEFKNVFEQKLKEMPMMNFHFIQLLKPRK